MKKTEEKIIRFIEEKNLIAAGDKILLALSGGPDSIFLLYFLNKFRQKYKITLGAIHINHSLRGADANGDEEFCRGFAEEHNVPFISVTRDVKKYSVKNKISVEEAGRIIRYNEFEKAARSGGYNKIATAHHAGDNLETVLLNLIKGAGIKGLSGIPVQRGDIIRPLLSISKEEILEYLHSCNIAYRTDASNLSVDYERNFLRNTVIPLIKERLNPNLEATVFNSSSILKSIIPFIDRVTDEYIKGTSGGKETITLPIAVFTKLDEGLHTYFVQKCVERNFCRPLTFNDLQLVVKLLHKKSGKKVLLSHGLEAIRERENLVVRYISRNKIEPVVISAGEKKQVAEKQVSIMPVNSLPQTFPGNKNKEYISADNLKNEFLIRKWEPGDRFFPFGMKGSKKISDYLTDKKINPVEKEKQLVLLNRNRIVWLAGLQIDNRFRITDKTKKVFELCII